MPIDNLKEERLKKLQNFYKQKINPYPARYIPKQSLTSVLKEEVGKEVMIGGRLIFIREMGKITFMHLLDGSQKMQIVFRVQDFQDDYDFWIKNLDLGDFVEIKGVRFDTQKKEKSVLVKEVKLLSKAIRPLPSKIKKIVDDDIRQRFRELEMIGDVQVLEKFKRRSKMLQVLRKLMWKNDFCEIETPILQTVYGGTYAKPFMTHYNALDFDLYLRIAPEIFLKRALVGGFEKVFEIGKCFRNEGMDPAHLQEFTMFEFYWAYADYNKLMDFSEILIKEVIDKVYQGRFEITLDNQKINLKPPYPRVTFKKIMEEKLKIDFKEIDTALKIEEFVKKRNLKIDFSGKTGWSTKLDELYKKTVRKELIQPVFITDYPKEFMALAKTKEENPKLVGTFQLVVNSLEVIKAYNELNDPLDQRQRFEEQERLAKAGDEESMPYDHDFVKSMEYGMPPVAGWGMGLDRFFTILEEENNLRDAIIFPTMKPIKNNPLILKNEHKEELGINYKKANDLLNKYITNQNTKYHLLETEAIMKELAKKLKQNSENWGIIGLLHDLDWDLTKDTPQKHTLLTKEILEKEGASQYLIDTIISHTYQTEIINIEKDKVRSSLVEFALASSETLTGLIIATALVQPNKDLASLKLKSLIKKFKSKNFASNCKRDIITECTKLGISLEEFLELGIKALIKIKDKIGFNR